MFVRTLKNRKTSPPKYNHMMAETNEFNVLFIEDHGKGVGTAYTTDRKGYNLTLSHVTLDYALSALPMVDNFLNKHGVRYNPVYLYGLLCNHRLVSMLPIIQIPFGHKHYLKSIGVDMFHFKTCQIIMPNGSNQFPWDNGYIKTLKIGQKIYADLKSKLIPTMEVVGEF